MPSPPLPPSLTHIHRRLLSSPPSRKEQRSRGKESKKLYVFLSDKERSQLLTMSLATRLILLPWLVLLMLHGLQGGRCTSLEMGMEEVEMQMEAERRRVVWEASSSRSRSRSYISYDALRGDVVPCSRPGVPYYNCRMVTAANPYTRGCQSITRCRDADP